MYRVWRRNASNCRCRRHCRQRRGARRSGAEVCRRAAAVVGGAARL